MIAVESKKKFAELLSQAIKDSGLSNAEVGRRIGKDRGYIFAAAKGTMVPEADTIIALARVLNLPAAELLEAAGRPNVAGELRSTASSREAEYYRLLEALHRENNARGRFARLKPAMQEASIAQLRLLLDEMGEPPPPESEEG